MSLEKEPWKLAVLEHDDASEEIGYFFEKIWQDGITKKEIKKKCLYNKEDITNEIEHALGNLEGKILTLYGTGYFHHYTYGMCNVIAKKRSEDYLYVHIDNHSDSFYHQEGKIDCASFTENIVEEPKAKDILFIGPDLSLTKHKRTMLTQEQLTSNDVNQIVKNILRSKPQIDTYLSLDLDILSKTEMDTSFQQGRLKIEHLLQILDIIQQEKNVISADMLGYREGMIHYSLDSASREISLLTYAVLAAKITGKDTKELEKLHQYLKTKRIEETKAHSLHQANWVLKQEFEKIIEQLRI